MPQSACIKPAIIDKQPLCVHYPPQKVSAVETKLEIIQLIPATDLNKTPYKIIKKYKYSCIVNKTSLIENKPLFWSNRTCILISPKISLCKQLINHIVMCFIANCINYLHHRVILFKLWIVRLDILVLMGIINIKQYQQVRFDVTYVFITTIEYLYFGYVAWSFIKICCWYKLYYFKLGFISGHFLW